MTSHTRDPRAEPVGSVAEEAARLIGLFAGQLGSEQAAGAGARAAGSTRAGSPRASSAGCTTCGHDPAADPSPVCRSCPMCRVLAVVRAISPDALDRAADLVDLVSDGLRSYASSRREALGREMAARAAAAQAAEAAAAAATGRFPQDGDARGAREPLFEDLFATADHGRGADPTDGTDPGADDGADPGHHAPASDPSLARAAAPELRR